MTTCSSYAKPRRSVCAIQPRKQASIPPKPNKFVLDEQYARSLEQQIKLLELENSFLRSKPGVSLDFKERCAAYKGSQQILLKEQNQVSLDGGKSWCQLPPYHPRLDQLLGANVKYFEDSKKHAYKDHASYEENDEEANEQKKESKSRSRSRSPASLSHTWEQKRRPSTILEEELPEKEESRPRIGSMGTSSRQTATTGRSNFSRKQMSLDQVPKSSKSSERRRASDIGNSKNSHLSRSIEFDSKVRNSANSRINATEFRHSEDQILILREKLRVAEEKIHQKAVNDTREKRSLMEEMLELQRRLDELTPILAAKEAHIVRLENARDEALSDARQRETEIRRLELELSDKQREGHLLSDREIHTMSEIHRMELELSRFAQKDQQLKDEITKLNDELVKCRQHGTELQLKLEREKAHSEQLTEENSRLISQNSEISAEVSRLEVMVSRAIAESEEANKHSVKKDAFEKIKASEAILRAESDNWRDVCQALREEIRSLENQITIREENSLEIRESRERVQRELDALQALSRSLTEENKALRSELFDVREKLELQKSKTVEREGKIFDLEDELRRIITIHETTLHQTEETRTKIEKNPDLEDITQRLKSLMDSLPMKHKPRSEYQSRENSSTSIHSLPHRSSRPSFSDCHSPHSPQNIDKLLDFSRHRMAKPKTSYI